MLPTRPLALQSFPAQGVRLSTVQLTINRGTTSDPLWYESFVLPMQGWEELYCRRYATEQDALTGHAEIVTMIESGALTLEVQ